ncbi:fibronectin type III domain-containing protein [Deferrisoma palaeochoriense]
MIRTAPVGPRVLLTVVLVALAAGCGRRGDPVPSSLRLPAAPEGVRLSAPGGMLRVAWDRPRKDLGGRPLEGLGGYAVLRAAWAPGEDACASCPEDARVVARVDPAERAARGLPAEAWEDPDVRPGWTYRYRVRALDPEGRPGPASAPADITWTALAPPRAEPIPGDSRAFVRVEPAPWPEGVEPLELRVYGARGGLLARAPAADGGVEVGGLENGRSYPAEVRVAGRTAEGWEVESPGASVRLIAVDTTPPVAPSTLAAFPDPEGVLLAWVSEGPEPYARVRIFRKTGDARAEEIARVDGTETRYLDRDPAPGHVVRYWIVVEDAAGNRSLPSREVEIRVPGPQPGRKTP